MNIYTLRLIGTNEYVYFIGTNEYVIRSIGTNECVYYKIQTN